jgi:hypothetical protein
VTPHPRGTIRPSFAKFNAQKNRGRRECRMLAAPAALFARVESTQVRHHKYAETFRHSLREGK